MSKYSNQIVRLVATMFLIIEVACRHNVPSVVKTFDEIISNRNGQGQEIIVSFERGPSHNHPSFAIWVEDTTGNYIQTLFITKAIATGVFEYGDDSQGKWSKGLKRRPAALPYWAHKRGIRATDGLYTPDPAHPIADAYTGATPKANFKLTAFLDKPAKTKLCILLEINQTWDWNEYWINSKYPDDLEYKTSCQPALVYKTTLDPSVKGVKQELQIVGHSHYSGSDGNLYPDISTLTTAKEIIGMVSVEIIDQQVQHE
jgi:hypothetical protein